MKYFKKKWMYAYSLVELLIVITIIAILATVSYPQYQQYIARATFSEAIQLVGACQRAVDRFSSLNNRLPNSTEIVNEGCNFSAGYSAGSPYSKNIVDVKYISNLTAGTIDTAPTLTNSPVIAVIMQKNTPSVYPTNSDTSAPCMAVTIDTVTYTNNSGSNQNNWGTIKWNYITDINNTTLQTANCSVLVPSSYLSSYF